MGVYNEGRDRGVKRAHERPRECVDNDGGCLACVLKRRVCLAGARVDLDRTDSRVEESWHALEQSHWRGCMANWGSPRAEAGRSEGRGRGVAGRRRAREMVYRVVWTGRIATSILVI